MAFCILIKKQLEVFMNIDEWSPYSAAAVVNLAAHVFKVPKNGFELMRGFRDVRGSIQPGMFLKWPRPGDGSKLASPTDPQTYINFLQLEPTQKPILDFANQHGLLVTFSHFHATPDVGSDYFYGEDLVAWQFEINRMKAAMDLWYSEPLGEIRRLLKLASQAYYTTATPPGWEPTLIDPRPRTWIDRKAGHAKEERNPRAFAREVVLATANSALMPETMDPPCRLCGGHSGSAQENAALTMVINPDKPELSVIPANLLKALWLQFAVGITNQKNVKKCAAPDCGKYMNVSDPQIAEDGEDTKARPGARRMHLQCARRWKQRRYRDKKKQSQKKSGG
jgi:hypothetical protein